MIVLDKFDVKNNLPKNSCEIKQKTYELIRKRQINLHNKKWRIPKRAKLRAPKAKLR